MAFISSHVGNQRLLRKLLRANLTSGGFGDLRYHLYQNDILPDRDSATADFTECDFDGYNSVLLEKGNWSEPTIVNGGAESTYGSDPISWTCGVNGNVVHGYYVVDEDSGELMWAERFSIPRPLTEGGTLSVQPVCGITSES